MKLKDFKDKPEQYNAIVESLKAKEIPFDDNSDISDLLAGKNAFENAINNIVAGGNKNRKR